MQENGNLKKSPQMKNQKHGNTNKQHAIKMSEWISNSNPKDWEKKFIFFVTNSSPDISLVHQIN